MDVIQVHEPEAMVIYAIMYGDCISSHRNSVSTTIYWGCHGEDAMIFQDYEGMQGSTSRMSCETKRLS